MEQADLFRRRNLPHWDRPDAVYFVTSCLEGSIPASGLLEIYRLREELKRRPKPKGQTEAQWKVALWKQQFVAVEKWLDVSPANRALAEPRLAQSVENSVFHFAGQRYDLLAYVVMPSHLHWVFWPLPQWVMTLPAKVKSARQLITYSLKRFTANECNRLRRTRGTFWQVESYDHWVRDAEELERIIHYVEWNPVKAGLVTAPEEWRFSSAALRAEMGIPLGLPLLRVPSPARGSAEEGGSANPSGSES